MGHDDDAVVLLAPVGPLGHEAADGIAQRGLVGAARGHGADQAAFVADEGYVSEDVLSVLGADAHEMFAVSAGLLGAPRRLAVEVADVGHQLAQLSCE